MRTMETKNRPRHVVFRVSDEEHKYISDACFEAGIRSVSEFVRQAALHFAETRRSNRSLLSDDLTTVALRLEELDGYLRDLSSVIIRILGPAHRPSATHGEASTASSDAPLATSEPGNLNVAPAQRDATGLVIALRKSV
jgi:uncharacterized protein (DUF1778 family)